MLAAAAANKSKQGSDNWLLGSCSLPGENEQDTEQSPGSPSHGVRSDGQNVRAAVCEWHETKEILIANIDHPLWSLARVAVASSLGSFALLQLCKCFAGGLRHETLSK